MDRTQPVNEVLFWAELANVVTVGCAGYDRREKKERGGSLAKGEARFYTCRKDQT